MGFENDIYFLYTGVYLCLSVSFYSYKQENEQIQILEILHIYIHIIVQQEVV